MHLISSHNRSMRFEIGTTWNSLPVDHKSVRFTLSKAPGGVSVSITAPFFDSPSSPAGKPGEPFPQLWEYEGEFLM